MFPPVQSELLSDSPTETMLIEKFKCDNLKDVAYSIDGVCADLKVTTIAKSWKKLLGEVEDEIMERESRDKTEKSILSSPQSNWM